jgi:hypothetical protein
MRLFSSLVVILGFTVLAGCGGSDVCGKQGKCPNDTAPTQQDKDTCEAFVSGSCGSQYKDYSNCYYDHETCTANGDSDTAAIDAACGAKLDAVNACLANP